MGSVFLKIASKKAATNILSTSLVYTTEALPNQFQPADTYISSKDWKERRELIADELRRQIEV